MNKVIKLINKLRNLKFTILRLPSIFWFKLLSDNKPKGSYKQSQPILTTGRGKLIFNNCNFGVWPSSHFFNTYCHIEARGSNSEITISENSWINNNASIIADRGKITIGKNFLAGTGLIISDSDFHSTDPNNRLTGNYKTQDVIIEDNVFVGSNVTICKGVKIGRNSVIGTGSIVTKNVEPYSIYAGNPAKLIKEIE